MSKTPQLLSQFNELTAASQVRALTGDEAHQFELLRDVLVELEALPAPAAEKIVLVRLSDEAEQAAVVELLRATGIRVETGPPSGAPTVAVVDTSNALAFAGAPLVLMNVSGADALTGQLARLEPAAFIKRRAPVAEVLAAVKVLLAR